MRDSFTAVVGLVVQISTHSEQAEARTNTTLRYDTSGSRADYNLNGSVTGITTDKEPSERNIEGNRSAKFAYD
jgi:phosphoribosylformylglycinamidine (FGAM) synthase-like amidotransferase family enzyme